MLHQQLAVTLLAKSRTRADRQNFRLIGGLAKQHKSHRVVLARNKNR